MVNCQSSVQLAFDFNRLRFSPRLIWLQLLPTAITPWPCRRANSRQLFVNVIQIPRAILHCPATGSIVDWANLWYQTPVWGEIVTNF